MTAPQNLFVLEGKSRRALKLSERLGGGANGDIYRASGKDTGLACKVYKQAQDQRQDDKVTKMISSPPSERIATLDGQRIVQLAWPEARVVDGNGRFVGFLMPEIVQAESKSLSWLLRRKLRQVHGLPQSMGFRVNVAHNLALLIASIHRAGYCMLDLKPDNVSFFKRSGLVCLVDCDGFVPADPKLPGVGAGATPGYILPEAPTRKNAKGETEFDVLAVRQQQDEFALAVMIFELLNEGIHPFEGQLLGQSGEAAEPQDRIAADKYCYGLIPRADAPPSPHSYIHGRLEDSTRKLFDQAFGTRQRPTASEWKAHLAGLIGSNPPILRQCGKDPRHFHFSKGCFECGKDDILKRNKQESLARAAKHRPPPPPPPPAAGVTPLSNPPKPPRITPVVTPKPVPPSPPMSKIFFIAALAVVALGLLFLVIDSGTDSAENVIPATTLYGDVREIAVQPMDQPTTFQSDPSQRVRVRSGPGEEFEHLASMEPGTVFDPSGTAAAENGELWYYVVFNNGIKGFVSGGYVAPWGRWNGDASEAAEEAAVPYQAPLEQAQPPQVRETRTPAQAATATRRPTPSPRPSPRTTDTASQRYNRESLCILPDGSEIQTSVANCRERGGLIFD
jgi:DNA-binding helix-hairpin-helix protein with protein kinase domain